MTRYEMVGTDDDMVVYEERPAPVEPTDTVRRAWDGGAARREVERHERRGRIRAIRGLNR
jgi:hypothetical protein